MTRRTVTLRRRRGAPTLQFSKCKPAKARRVPVPEDTPYDFDSMHGGFLINRGSAIGERDITRPAKRSYLYVPLLVSSVPIHTRRWRG